MFENRTVRNTGFADLSGALGSHATLALLALAAAVPVALSIALVSPAAVLPTISLVAFFLAAIGALAAWTFKAKRHGNRVTLWDIAGALVFIGCAAAMLSRPDNVLQLLGTPMVP